MCRFCAPLESDGFVVIEDAVEAEVLNSLRAAYARGWAEIRQHWTDLQWRTRTYNADCQRTTRFVGVDLYDGYRSAEYKETEVLDMGRGRYDFSYGLPAFTEANMPPALAALAQCQLRFEYSHCLGGLPVLQDADNSAAAHAPPKHGTWHRDAYSLFDEYVCEELTVEAANI